MTTREFTLLMLLLVVVLLHIAERELALRLDWIDHGTNYRASMQDVGRALNDLGREVQELKKHSPEQK